jgi:ketosteroid isomerase-like protein
MIAPSQHHLELASREEVTVGHESLDDAVAASHAATDRIMRGDAGGFKDLYSQRGDITLGNPFGGFGHGRDGVVEQLDRAASYFSDGRATDFEEIAKAAAAELAYTVEIERVEVKVAGREEPSEFGARVTSVYRREEDGWKLVHRHADPRVSRQTATSVLST